MNLTEHRISEIFANVKKGQKDDSEDLDQPQFAQAMGYLNQKSIFMSLESLGISPAVLSIILVLISVTLIFFLLFIFSGIKAFAMGGTFGAIVNSIMPIGKKQSLN